MEMKFEDLPITFDEKERMPGGWCRPVKRQGTVEELLEIWDIEYDDSEMSQVLRHLRWAMGMVEELFQMRELARNLRDNFDHDEDAHKHNTYCRKCEAESIIGKRA